MGHWPSAVHIPGTDQYLSIPLAGHETHDDEHNDAHSHTQHCHGNAASCSDVPTFAGVSFAVMQEVLAVFTASALLWALALRWWEPRRPNAIVPELRPPRLALG